MFGSESVIESLGGKVELKHTSAKSSTTLTKVYILEKVIQYVLIIHCNCTDCGVCINDRIIVCHDPCSSIDEVVGKTELETS